MRKKMWKRTLSVTLSVAMAVASVQFGGFRTSAATKSTGSNTVTQITEEQASGYETWREDTRTSVHDPSVVQDPKTGRYYIFGSHLAWSYSDDLQNWTSFKNNITDGTGTTNNVKDKDTASEIFAAEIEWCKKANSSYTVVGNMWAPDVIWNETMKKWCMYMSINGPKWNSTICLLTADSLEGNWTYVGPVIQSGMSNGFGPTFDYERVMGNTDVSRFTSSLSGGGNPTIEAHAIDPCVIYDDEGNLWMTYGSWSGGISMIRLDNETGLRDYDVTYENTNNTVGSNGYISDPYTGYKIAGGTAASGEGSYLQKIGNYYYMFLSYGGYEPKGGYNMRVFRSSDIKGPYLDVAGKDARRVVNNKAGDTNGSTGMRLMSYYQWAFQDYGHTASGHNSAIVDKDTGKAFVVYHDKYNDGTAGHLVRTHQLFINEDGWMVAAPFEYKGETVSDTGYDVDTFTGDYQMILQKQSVNAASLECCTEESIQLGTGTETEDGTGYTGDITGAYTGTWTSQKGSPYVTLKMGGVTYKGVLCEGTLEETNIPAMTFTAVGNNNVCIWGYKVKDEKAAIQLTVEKTIQIPKTIAKDIDLPANGFNGTTIQWKSNHMALSSDGKVLYLKEDSQVTLTATIRCGSTEYIKSYDVTVLGSKSLSSDKEVLLDSYYTEEPLTITGLKKGDAYVRNPFFQSDANLNNGATISFDVKRTSASGFLSNILTFLGTAGRLYFTGGSYLGYNGPGGFFDANVNYWSQATDYLKDSTSVNIKMKFTSDGFTVYADGVEIYSKSTLKAGTTKGAYNDTASLDASLMSWLVNNASRIHFGYGSWWDGAFNGEVSNLKFYYTQPAIDVTGGSTSSGLTGLYTQDYEDVTDIANVWTSPNAQEALALANNEAHGNYMTFIHNNITGSKNSRGMYSDFGSEVNWEDQYILEFDMGYKSGNDQESQFVVTNTNGAYASNNVNYGMASGYVLKLSTTNSTEWKINDSDATVTLPAADADSTGWIHVKITGDTSAGTAKLVITDDADNSLYDDTITMNNAANVKGFYVLAGRYSSIIKVDNIVVKKPGVISADFSSYNTALARAEKFVEAAEKYNAFTTDSLDALKTAIATARATVTPDMEKSKQSIVDAQTNALVAAMDALVFATYTIKVNSSTGGTVTGLATNGTYQGGSSVTLTAVPNAGYVLVRWEDSKGNILSTQQTYTDVVTRDVTIVPVFRDPNQSEPVAPATPQLDAVAYTPTLTLNDIELPAGWTWDAPDTALTTIGTNAYPATYKTTDASLYKDTTANIDVTVEKAVPTFTDITKQTYEGKLGQKLSTVTLPEAENGTWNWADPDTVMTVSTNKFEAVFTPTDSEHYKNATCMITVTIKDENGNEVVITPAAPQLDAITYESGLVLGDVPLPDDWKWKDSTIALSAGTGEYEAIYVPNKDEVKITVTVSKNPDPSYTLVDGLKGTEGDKLETVVLPNGWKWKEPQQVLTKTQGSYVAIYTHPSGNYEDIEVSLDVSVKAKETGDADNTGDNGNTGGTDNKVNTGGSQSGGNNNNSSSNGNTNTPTTQNTLKDGDTYTAGGIKYKVLSATKKTAAAVGVSKKTVKTLTMKSTVKVKGVTLKVTEIGNSAFANCKKLKTVTISTNVTKIGKKAFYKCAKLKTITIKSKKLKSVGSNALKGIYKKAVIKVPKAKYSSYKKLLKKKGQSSKVKIKK